MQGSRSFHLATLGCPKNAVDSDKLATALLDDGLVAVEDPARADLVVLDTCASVEAAREESIEGAVPAAVVGERIRELSEVQDRITVAERHAVVGTLVRSRVVAVEGPDLPAVPLAPAAGAGAAR